MEGASTLYRVEYKVDETRKRDKFKPTEMQKMDTSWRRWDPTRRAKAYFEEKLREASSDIVGNIEFSIENVHVRLEGCHDGADENSSASTPTGDGSLAQRLEFALGITVDKIQIKNEERGRGEWWAKDQFTRKSIWLGAAGGKLENSSGFAVYCNDTKLLGSSDNGKALPSAKANSVQAFKDHMNK